MKEYRLTPKQILSWSPGMMDESMVEFVVKNSLRAEGFNMKKEIIKYRDYETRDIVFQQQEEK